MIRRLAWFAGLLLLSAAGLLLPGYYRFLYYEIAAWSLLALSVDILYGQAGMLSFGQSVFLALSGYTFLHLSTIAAVGVVGAALIGVTISVAVAAAIGHVMVRLEGHYFVIGTVILALGSFLVASSLTRWTGGDDGLPAGPFAATSIAGLPLSLPSDSPRLLYFAVGLIVAFLFGLTWKVRTSALGLLVAGVKHEPFRMSALGYPVTTLKYAMWCFAAAVAASAGVTLIVVNRYASATHFHWSTTGEGFVWAILGGVDTVWGALIGAAVLVTVKDLLSTRFAFYPILVGLLLIALMYLRSQGLLRAVTALVGLNHIWRRARPQTSVAPEASVDRVFAFDGPAGPLISLRDVRKVYRGTVALDRCEWDLSSRAFRIRLHDGRECKIEAEGKTYPAIALVGPNGAGKTTLLNVLCGYLRPDSGVVSSDVLHIEAGRATPGIARSFQEPRLWESMSVYENLLLGGMRRRAWRSLQPIVRRDDLLGTATINLATRLGLRDYLDADAATLSFGKRKVLDIGIALASHPSLLTLDEPSAGVSPRELRDLEKLIRDVVESVPIVLVEHNLETIRRLGFPVLFMAEGRLLECGSLNEVLSRDSVRAQFSGLRTDEV